MSMRANEGLVAMQNSDRSSRMSHRWHESVDHRGGTHGVGYPCAKRWNLIAVV